MHRFTMTFLPLAFALSGCPDDNNAAVDSDAETAAEVGVEVETSSDGGTETDGGAETDIGGAEIALAELAQRSAAELCPLLFDCPTLSTSDDDVFTRAYLIDKARCPARLVPFLDGYLLPLVRRVAAGSLRYDAAAAASCTSGWSCDDLVSDNEDFFYEGRCADVFDGTVAAGGECSQPADCAGSDVTCSFDGGTCPGTCRPAVALGQTCQLAEDCSTSGGSQRVVCSYGDNDGSCKLEVLATPAGEGAGCGVVEAADMTRTPCAQGHHCVIPDDAATGTCVKDAAPGAACSGNPGCVVGYVCVAGTCQVLPFGSLGDACEESENALVLCDPFATLQCDGETGTCVAAGAGAPGDPCRKLGFFGTCNTEAWCDDTLVPPICAPLKALGESCESTSECRSGSCDYASGKCALTECQAF